MGTPRAPLEADRGSSRGSGGSEHSGARVRAVTAARKAQVRKRGHRAGWSAKSKMSAPELVVLLANVPSSHKSGLPRACALCPRCGSEKNTRGEPPDLLASAIPRCVGSHEHTCIYVILVSF